MDTVAIRNLLVNFLGRVIGLVLMSMRDLLRAENVSTVDRFLIFLGFPPMARKLPRH